MNPQEQSQVPQEKSFGATIGIILIIIAVVLGALYLWGGQITSQNSTPLKVTNITATTSNATSTPATTGY